MKKGLVFATILITILLVGTISAMTVNVRTLPNNKVNIRLATTSSGALIDSKVIMTGPTGLAEMDYSGSLDEVKIQVTISKDGERVLFENFGDFPTTSDLYLQAIPNKISSDYKTDDEVEAAAEEAARCQEDWVCEEWVKCVKNEEGEGGTQERVCTDNNACGREEDLPATTQECEPGIMSSVTGLVINVKESLVGVKDKLGGFNWMYILYSLVAIGAIGGSVVFIMHKKGNGDNSIESSTQITVPDNNGDTVSCVINF